MEAVTVSAETGFTEQDHAAALELLEACRAGDISRAQLLIEDGAHAWVQDDQGSTSLHAAVESGNVQLVDLLLCSSNAVLTIPDDLGYTAGDLAYSLNAVEMYELLLGESVRAELLKALMRKMMGGGDSGDDDGSDEELEALHDDEDMAESTEFLVTPPSPPTQAQLDPVLNYAADISPLPTHAPVPSSPPRPIPTPSNPKMSTAASNKAFLASRLRFEVDSHGQEICVDAEGNGVMMGWERGIMLETAEALSAGHAGRREGHGLDQEFWTVNVGFGLGIIDTALQTYKPSHHLIIEAHPDVLAHARAMGFYDRPGVRFYEGTWKAFVADVEAGREDVGRGFDAIYWDTYSEHYHDLHEFFRFVPTLLAPAGRFSFFHGLGATSRLLYDTYTAVATHHLQKLGIDVKWSDVDLSAIGGDGSWEGVERRYWEDLVGPYRLPLGQMKM